MADLTHGTVGKREHNFTALLPLRTNNYDPQQLAALAAAMKGEVDTVKDGPDPEENLLVPAGYTYFGQFIDHDLTFDSTSSLDFSSSSAPSNTRTPRFDLDCLYGDGPDAQPFMYDGAKLIFKDGPVLTGPTDLAGKDLTRNSFGRAIIGDKRNDENSIVSQIQYRSSSTTTRLSTRCWPNLKRCGTRRTACSSLPAMKCAGPISAWSSGIFCRALCRQKYSRISGTKARPSARAATLFIPKTCAAICHANSSPQPTVSDTPACALAIA